MKPWDDRIGPGIAGPVVVVTGPTASGKSALALALAARFDGVVINADSMQLYRELRVITARPDAAALARAPHRLYGTVAAVDGCSAGGWREMALAEIEAAHGVGRLPVVAGGTGLYIRALITGLARMPAVPVMVRAAARNRLARDGAGTLHRDLRRRDPEMAARLEPGDGQRIARAWEVLEATGRSLADWQREPSLGFAAGLRFLIILLAPPRDALYAACDDRFERMIEAGALDEARTFATLGLDPALPACKAVGLRPLMRWATGDLDREQARMLGTRETRRYAKRQATWFRHQLTPDRVVDAQYSESMNSKIFPFISDFLLTASG